MAENETPEDGDRGAGKERDRYGLLPDRPWYRHPFVILTAAGLALFLLNWYMAANRTAGVPIFG